MATDSLFVDITPPVQETPDFVMQYARLPNFRGFSLGGGTNSIKLSDEGFWAGAESFAAAPFSVDLQGNVVGIPPPKFKVGTITISATGSLSITGVGFKPKLLTIYSANGSATPRLVQSTGVSDGSNTLVQYIWEDSTAPNYVSDFIQNTTGAFIINLTRNSGTNQQRADLTSLDTDGFTLNVVSNSLGGTSRYSYVAQA